METYWEILSKKYKRNFSNEFKDLIENLLNPNPEKRFTVKEVLNHNWFKFSIDENEIK